MKLLGAYNCVYSWLAFDFTKSQTKKLLILLSFSFHEALKHLNTFTLTNFWFETVLRFAIPDAWISRLLRAAPFSWRQGELLWAKNVMDFGRFCYLNIPCLRINIIFNLYEFLKRRIHALVGKLENRCFCWYPAAIFILVSQRHQHGLSIQSFISLRKPFCQISRIWNIAQTWF